MLCLLFRGEAPAEDVPRPLQMGGDLKANGNPNLPDQCQSQIANHHTAKFVRNELEMRFLAWF